MKGNSTRKLSLASVLAALSVVFLFLGSVISVLDLSAAALASLIVLFAAIELGSFYPWMIWLVASVLSMLLCPDKFGALVFLVFAGYYPIVKKYIERTHIVIQWIIKLLIFNVILTGIVYISLRFLGMPETEIAYTIPVYAVCNVAFIIYDIALTCLISTYFFKVRDRIRFLLKKF